MNSFNVNDYPLLRVLDGEATLREMIAFPAEDMVGEEDAAQLIHAISMQWDGHIKRLTPEIYSGKIPETDAAIALPQQDIRVILFPAGITALTMTSFSHCWTSLTVFNGKEICVRAFDEQGCTKGWLTTRLIKEGRNPSAYIDMFSKYVSSTIRQNAAPYKVFPGRTCRMEEFQYRNDTGRPLLTYDKNALTADYN